MNFLGLTYWLLLSGILILGGCAQKKESKLSEIDYKNGKFSDTGNNRRHFDRVYRHLIAAEKSDNFQESNWRVVWKRVIEEVEENTEDPEAVKALIRQLRSEAGLPIWDFM